MIYTVKTFETESGNKRVGFIVENNGRKLAIDKLVPIADGKSDESYVKDALSLAQVEINSWVADTAILGKKWNPETNSLVE